MNDLIQKYKIYGRKKGRKNINAFSSSLKKKFQLNLKKDINNKKKIILDIGFGNGESTIFLSKKNPDKIIVASDVFLDGNINLSGELNKNNIKNVKIFNKNILILFDKTNLNKLVDEIWILFPDPWPKKKHHKRRLINISFFKKISSFANSKTHIFIATDSKRYFNFILSTVCKTKLFKWINDIPFQWDYSFYDLPITSFYRKALRNNQKSFIIVLKKYNA